MERLRPDKPAIENDPKSDSHADKNVSDITILLLGETGVGKSTWINGFANFLQFKSLDEAETNSTLCLIPSSFTITDEKYEERLISTGEDINEVMDPGQSATQHPQSYVFPQNGKIVRLIDTPGIGDVRGVKQDKKNFELILDHISHLSELHAICILLKPNNARLNIMFSFCIKELLTHLHKDACRNIVFCFTNSRSTFYRPGDTLPALRKLLEENKQQVDIKLNQSTLYCMDNEAIRFLYAVKDGIQFTPDERNNYIASWEKSVDEINRLLTHAEKQKPHSIENTLSLNNVRQTILALGSPMAEVARNIQFNITQQEVKKNELLNSQKSKEELCKELITVEYDVNLVQFKEPITVCAAVTCVEFVQVGGITETHYKTHCHGNCSRGKEKTFGYLNKKGHKKLRKCSAFDRKTGKCKNCDCNWAEHMKIGFQTKYEMKTVNDTVKHIGILNEEHAMKKIRTFLKSLDENMMQLKEEQTKITNASVVFAQFLKTNAITPYNDSMDAYLMHFINQEKDKVAQKRSDPKILQGMLQMRENYKEQMILLEKAMQSGNGDTTITPQQMEMTIKNLYKLQHSGHKLMEMMNKSNNYAKANYTEKRIEKNDSFTTTTTTTSPCKKDKASMNKIGTQISKEKETEKEERVKWKKDSRCPPGKKPLPPLPPRPLKPEIRKPQEHSMKINEKLPIFTLPIVKDDPSKSFRPFNKMSPHFSGGHKATWQFNAPEGLKYVSPLKGPEEQKLTLSPIFRVGQKSTMPPKIQKEDKLNPQPRPGPITATNIHPAALLEQIRNRPLLKVISSNNELLKRVLDQRALRIQDSSLDDDEDDWD